MQERNITINYCNNIKKAQISIVEHALNIKFGHNGTGKSTISEAIRLKIEGDDLKKLTPFSAADSSRKLKCSMKSTYSSIYSSKMVFLMIHTKFF